MEEYYFFLFFIVAFLYSSIGFGGGSSYLALLTLMIPNFFEIRTVALLLNILVVTINLIIHFKHKLIRPKLFYPFIISGLLSAFLGSQIDLTEDLFFVALSIILVLSGIMLLLRSIDFKINTKELSLLQRFGLGGSVGFFAGLSGIGGGIFLAPILHVMQWENPRTVSSLASLFIWFNSLAGLIGLMWVGKFNLPENSFVFPILIAVGLGSWIGNNFSLRFLSHKSISILTAILIIFVGVRLFMKYQTALGM